MARALYAEPEPGLRPPVSTSIHEVRRAEQFHSAGAPAHRDRQDDSGANFFRELVLTRGNMNQIHATT